MIAKEETMRHLLWLPIVLLTITGCMGIVEKVNASLDAGKKLVITVQDYLDQGKQYFDQTKVMMANFSTMAKDTLAKVDANNDGERSTQEWVKWVMGGGAATVISGGIALMRGAIKGQVRVAQSDALKQQLKDRVEKLEKGITS